MVGCFNLPGMIDLKNAKNYSCLPKYDSHMQGLSLSSLETASCGDGVLS